MPGRKQLGADATSMYPVGDPVRLVLTGEPPEKDFASNAELRAVIMDSEDTSLECEMVSSSCACLEEMEETVHECCTATEWSPNNKMYMANTNLSIRSTHVVSWNDLKEATVADKTIQELLNLLQSGVLAAGQQQ